MSKKKVSSRFQQVIETVEALPPDDQLLLIEIIRQRLIQPRRAELAAEIAEARDAYQRGDVRRGTVADLMKALAECEPLSGVRPLCAPSNWRFAASRNCGRGVSAPLSNSPKTLFTRRCTATS